ncbi:MULTISPECIES: AAA family ATPase [Methylomonas]|uniref:AAA family ATPase n=1 Tax=Methylomonas koyamae TaxID=702114 RepID=A0A177NGZ3_9GAMM|nr:MULTISPECIES: MoxR family ATPase [Methylomonas]NJA05232.1 MoxR family ATPase [Methylococcaceae bacterium WWC4]OAI16703.1 AAA family ATPase [Methylomonas koyamae]OHX36260.1 AAA family ATPase [Methylomonas sp. LWB]
MITEHTLASRRDDALALENQINRIVVGQRTAVRNLLIAVFARGHVLLEGQVGVGKTTLLRTVAQGLGGRYQRIEGTIDLMPADLIYYTYLNQDGRPCVDPGPLLKQGEQLSVFFFNEINRARPQVHSLLLRVMAERAVGAFNREYRMPHMLVFADRNRVEREETFELPAAARDRFLMEINIAAPGDDAVLDELMFDPRFHDVDALIAGMAESGIGYQNLNALGEAIQQRVQTSPALRKYALDLAKASGDPKAYGISLSDVEMERLLHAGVSPRGMSYLIRAAKVRAWLEQRDSLWPEDIQAVFAPTMSHRLFLNPIYAYRHDELLPALVGEILNHIAAP